MTLRNIPTATYAHNALSCIQWRTIGAGHEKGKNKLQIRNSTAKFLIFTRQANEDGIEVRVAEETVWLTQKPIGVLFDKGHSTITEHLKNIFETRELDEKAVCRDFRHTAEDGKDYTTRFYNLDFRTRIK
ncbi:MAG TPA: phosphoribosylaminoimidazolesuccinocarboxamide synthase [Syntrophus sp. (in: bacteria)]|nr:phosphoribosylaminoimidazolesuccinocarboxamide synthase [Syntrophus sp. (in: bacteria)]